MVEFLLLNLCSESDSGDQLETEMLAYVALRRTKSMKRAYMKKRKTHG
jgi:hypothetical protein